MKKEIFFILIILLLPINIKAKSYEILTYDVDINVNENKTMYVTETYNIYFTEKDNFIKKLNDKLVIIRPNGSKENVNQKFSNISVLVNDEKTNYELKNNEINIKYSNEIGDINKYTITYNYDYNSKIANDFYFELINNILDTNISSVNFKITFPKKFDTKNIKLIYNSLYDDKYFNYSVSNNTIVGTFNQILKQNENIAIYVKMPFDYFKGSNNYIYLLLIIPIATLIIGIIYYKKYCKNNRLKILMQDNIPYDYNSAEIAYLYKGYLKEHDLNTVLITLANNGYIKFIELDDGYKLGTFNSFKIEKIKDYDGDNAAVKLIFEKLFQTKDLIELKDIEYNLYETLKEAKSAIDNEDNKQKMFFSNVKRNKKILLIAIIISIIVINYNSIYLLTGKYYLIPIINLLMITGIYVLVPAKVNKLIKVIIGVPLTLITLYIGIIPIISETIMLITYIIGMILILISIFIYKLIPDRTKYGNEVLGNIIGFKKTLENLNVNQIKQILESNSNYYYEMYPYIYILDLTNIWIHKFEGLIDKYPDWYITKEPFSLNNFQNFINNMIFTVTQAMFKRQLTGQSSVHVEYHKDSIKQNNS